LPRLMLGWNLPVLKCGKGSRLRPQAGQCALGQSPLLLECGVGAKRRLAPTICFDPRPRRCGDKFPYLKSRFSDHGSPQARAGRQYEVNMKPHPCEFALYYDVQPQQVEFELVITPQANQVVRRAAKLHPIKRRNPVRTRWASRLRRLPAR